MDCKLQVFKLENERNSRTDFRFAVVDHSKSNNYPANFVCMLPLKIEVPAAKTTNVFGNVFGDKSTDFAIQLLNKALISESDKEIKLEIARRLTLLEPKQTMVLTCSECKKRFQAPNNRKYKHPFCSDCFSKRYSRK
jgi:hypothetical protein